MSHEEQTLLLEAMGKFTSTLESFTKAQDAKMDEFIKNQERVQEEAQANPKKQIARMWFTVAASLILFIITTSYYSYSNYTKTVGKNATEVKVMKREANHNYEAIEKELDVYLIKHGDNDAD